MLLGPRCERRLALVSHHQHTHGGGGDRPRRRRGPWTLGQVFLQHAGPASLRACCYLNILAAAGSASLFRAGERQGSGPLDQLHCGVEAGVSPLGPPFDGCL